MTARDFLNIRVRRARNIFYSGGVVTLVIIAIQAAFIATMPRGSREPDWFVFIFVGAVLAGVVIAVAADRYGRSTVRCPWCGGELYWLTFNRSYSLHRSFSLAHVKFCLHCGRSLDDKLPIGGKSGKLTAKPTPWEDELS
jgi:hypothetical protein